MGPAYFAWQWMANIEGVGGPLPKDWIDTHIKLGQKILERQRSLGMKPIQQGFSGYVPNALKEKYPDARIKSKNFWCGFPSTSQLDPLDPLFKKIGRTFLEEQKKLFGTSHLYAADPFHESAPPVKGKEYLNKTGKAISDLFTRFDRKAIWVMQSWSLRKDIVLAVDKKKLLIVDLEGTKWQKKKYRGFWGYNFVVGQLHNFGGRINLQGSLEKLAQNKFATAGKRYKNFAGRGLFMEAIEQNPVFYELFFDMLYKNKKVSIGPWIEKYVHRRYGVTSEKAKLAWKNHLLKGPYANGTDSDTSSIIAARPALIVKRSGPYNIGFSIPYPPLELVEGLNLLLSDYQQLENSSLYQYDMVDILRQALANLGQVYYKEVVQAYLKGDIQAFQRTSKRFITLLKDVDTLLATRKEFLLGKWIKDAASWAKNDQDKELYVRNAKALVTIWGEGATPLHLFDYSWREWSGLIGTFYVKRWQIFFNHLEKALKNNISYRDPTKKMTEGREGFRANDFYNTLADFELKWIEEDLQLPSEPKANALETVLRMYEKYKGDLNNKFQPSQKGYQLTSELKKFL